MSNFGGPEVFVQEVIESITSVTGHNSIALHEPEFDGNEWDYVKECIDSNLPRRVDPPRCDVVIHRHGGDGVPGQVQLRGQRS